jgi:hypothetical protein
MLLPPLGNVGERVLVSKWEGGERRAKFQHLWGRWTLAQKYRDQRRQRVWEETGRSASKKKLDTVM